MKDPLIQKTIYPAQIRLSAEPDYQNFLIKFKQKLVRELENIYYSLTGTDIAPELNSMNIDDSITFIFKSIEKRKPCKGFVILIDDIYKLPDYEHVALKFLNHLQTFKAELTRELQLPNVGFFISAPPDWKEKLSKPIYSGSVSREEEMPKPTVENALDMLNERLTAFSFDKKKRQWIKLDFAQQVYRTLESRKGFTFREFIKECLSRFESGNFDILISNPVSISGKVFRNIIEILKDHSVNKNFNEILNSSLSPTDKTECLQLLIKVCNNKGYSEDSELYKDKTHYFMLLRNAGLISKIKKDGSAAIWAVSKDFGEFNEIVWNKYSFSINDYLLKLFKGRLDSAAFEIALPERSEISEYEKLRNYINKKSDAKFSDVKYWLEYSFDIHKRIVSEISAPYIHASYNKMEEDCKDSIDAITKAVAYFTGISVNPSEFWNDFWYVPQSLHDFIQVHRSQGKLPEPSSTYLYGSYQSLFIEIFKFLSDQIYKTDILPIPYVGPKNKEIEVLNAARSDFANQDYPSVISKTTCMIETKLRDFIYSVFLLQYGDRNHRMQRIPIKLHEYINKNPVKDKRYAFEFVGNELTYLNRHQYYPILLGPGIGSDNWEHTFSHVFLGWNYAMMASYMQSFFKFNLTSSHNKVEVLRRARPSDIYDFLINSITLLVMINKSYFAFLDNAKKLEISGSKDSGYYFSLDNLKDKFSLQPVRVSNDNERRILDLFKNKTNTIDFSDPSSLEQKYGVSYRELFAIIFRILKEKRSNFDIKNVKEDPPIITISMN
ncbi:MAG TPA: hypothetical protein VLD84_06840 [Nitrososphaeraceae archaeon]|nr:hypothetical protein [Nitrososphaeraceae archaeon]